MLKPFQQIPLQVLPVVRVAIPPEEAEGEFWRRIRVVFHACSIVLFDVGSPVWGDQRLHQFKGVGFPSGIKGSVGVLLLYPRTPKQCY